jgi:hypothetical protein
MGPPGRRKALGSEINDTVVLKYPIVARQADQELVARYGVAANELDRLNATIVTEKADAPGQRIADLAPFRQSLRRPSPEEHLFGQMCKKGSLRTQRASLRSIRALHRVH